MAYIICEPCVGTKDTACVDVCPVDCIKTDEEAQVWNIGMRYKIMDANTTEQVAQGWVPEVEVDESHLPAGARSYLPDILARTCALPCGIRAGSSRRRSRRSSWPSRISTRSC